MNDESHPTLHAASLRNLARIIARLNAAHKAGKISERQWYALVAAAIGEFR